MYLFKYDDITETMLDTVTLQNYMKNQIGFNLKINTAVIKPFINYNSNYKNSTRDS